MIGETLAHYKILDKLGEGGMGEVYLAEDTRLKRKVALKVLPAGTGDDPDRLARFKREAETVASLNHPNIVTIFSVEQVEERHFLTMEWVEGKTLGELLGRGPIPLDRVFELATPIADALASAHDRGITHRDLKPANIMVTNEGRVKILDFGLAKLHEHVGTGSEEPPTQALTQEGMAVGTVPYMSPEQVRGETVDARSDIFSLGVVLYEMVAGRRPFDGKSSADLVSSILRDKPPSVTDLNTQLPYHLGRVIQRCLEKDPEKRYQSAKDVRNELEGLENEVESGIARVSSASIPAASAPEKPSRPAWLIPLILAAVLLLAIGLLSTLRGKRGVSSEPEMSAESAASVDTATPAADRDMVIVLPFENLGPAEDEYFAAGIADEINGRLASISTLGVISRKTASRYAGSEVSTQELGRELDVDYVLGGTVRWARNADGTSRVRVAPELIRVADDTQVWTEIYDRELDDIFEVQSEIAGRVLDALDVTVLGEEREALESRPTENLEAWQAYLQAVNVNPAQFGGDFVELDRRVTELYERAAALDPSFVEALTHLSRHHSLAYNGGFRTEDRLSKAREALARAEALGEDLPAVRLARGFYHYYGFRDYDRALEEFEAAAQELPNDAEAIQSIAFIQRRKGRLEECIDGLERAIVLDPSDSNLYVQLAATHRAQRRLEPAIEAIDRGLAIAPGDPTLYLEKSGMILDLTGDIAEARRIFEQAPAMSGMMAAFNSVGLLTAERDWDGLIGAMNTIESGFPLAKAAKAALIALAVVQRDGAENATVELDAATQALTEALEASPGDASLHNMAAFIYALQGRADQAVRAARLAVDLQAKDLFGGPAQLEGLALTLAIVGRTDEALDTIERLLSMEYEGALTRHELRIAPSWDVLRDEPRFQQLVGDS